MYKENKINRIETEHRIYKGDARIRAEWRKSSFRAVEKACMPEDKVSKQGSTMYICMHV